MRAADLARVARLEVELFGRGAWSRASLAEELAGPSRWYLVASELSTPPAGPTVPEPVGPVVTASCAPIAGVVVGYAGLWFDGVDAQVLTLAVAAERQGRGIGRRLLTALVDHARELAADRVLLEVRVDNEPALRLYESMGFRTIGRRRGYYQPENVDAWTMTLDLAGAG